MEKESGSLLGSDGSVHRGSMMNEGGKLQEAINQYPLFSPLFKGDTPIHIWLSCLILKMMEEHPELTRRHFPNL